MKWFYPTALAVVAALVASPLVLLPWGTGEGLRGNVVWDVYTAPVKSIDPATCGDTASSSFQGNMYEGLYHYHYLKRPAAKSVICRLAAEMPEISDDGLTYRVPLRPGVKYHRNPCFGTDPNGRPRTRTVRAEDFILAFKRIADYHVNTGLAWAFVTRIKGLKAYRRRTERYKIGDFSRYDLPVEGLRAIDDRTLEIRLTEPYPQLLYVLAMNVYAPVPREAVDYWLGTADDGQGGRRTLPVEERATEFREAEQTVGTGPYYLASWVRKARLILRRNPDYREDYYPTEGEEGDAEKGLLDDAGQRVPFIDAFRYDYVAESHSAWMLFESAQRSSSGISKELFDEVVRPDRKLTEKFRRKRMVLENYWPPSVYWIVFNIEDPLVGASKAFRQALCLCFDVESYLKVLFNNRGRRAVSVVPSSFPAWKEAGPGPYFRLDMERARAKLAAAKKELAAKGLLVNGRIPTLTLDMSGTSGEMARRGEFFRQQFAKLGVRMKFILNDWPKLQEKVNNKQCQMYTMGWHADYPDSENFLQLYYGPNIDKQTNNSNYANPAFDRLYERARVMADCPERTDLYARMIRIIGEDCPVLMLTEPQSYVLTYGWIKNGKRHPLAYGYAKYRRLDQALRREIRQGR